jgi:hypothetical protein
MYMTSHLTAQSVYIVVSDRLCTDWGADIQIEHFYVSGQLSFVSSLKPVKGIVHVAVAQLHQLHPTWLPVVTLPVTPLTWH